LGVSRGIVELAFEQLSLEGYVTSRVGRGTEVIADLAVRTSTVAPTEPAKIKAENILKAPEHLAESGKMCASQTKPLPTNSRLVDTSLFTIRVWHKHLNSAMKDLTPALLAENDPKGYEPLRHSISRYLRMTRGIQCETSQIVVTTGIRHAIDLISKTLVRGDTPFLYRRSRLQDAGSAAQLRD
jgi:GntR family transcriptional regulator/MocR family aminotransferase